MRVLLVIDRFGSGGAQTQMALLCQGLVRVGCEVAIFTYHHNEFLQTEELLRGATLIETKKITSLSVLAQLSRAMNTGGYDGVVAFLTGPSAYASAACCLTAFRGKLVVSERNIFRSGRPTPREWLQRLGHHVADTVVANSRTQARLMGKAFPGLRGRLRAIPNAVDVDHFAPATANLRKAGTLLAIGRIVEEKNALGLARALAALLRSGRQDVCVRWVGKVHSSEYFEACRQLLAKSGIEDRWFWEGEQADVREYYHRADWVVLPSFQEGMPNVIGEALASGVPCVMSNVSDATWLMDDGRNGYVFDPKDEADLVSKLSMALALPEAERAEMARNARIFAERELSLDAMVREYLGLLRT